MITGNAGIFADAHAKVDYEEAMYHRSLYTSGFVGEKFVRCDLPETEKIEDTALERLFMRK